MKRLSVIAAAALVLFSCKISNDLDYPSEVAEIVEFNVVDAKTVAVNNAARTVSIDLEEWADISAVMVDCVAFSEGIDSDLPEVLDLSAGPFTFNVHGYRSYEWTVSATQTIDRHIRCANQVGEAKFNVDKHVVFVYFPESQPLISIEFQDIKLEAERTELISTTGYSVGSTTTKSTLAVNLPMTLDCQLDRIFTVKVGEQYIDWTLRAIQVRVSVKIDSVRPYCYHARVRGIHDGTGSPVLEYRTASSSSWTTVAGAVISGTGISADITGLSEDTEYLVRLVDGENVSEEVPFRTDKAAQLDNMGFDSWHQDGKVWYPYPSGGTEVWATANPATGQFLGNTTTPDADNVAVSGTSEYSAVMESSFMMVKFAAGNLFTGQFVKLVGLGAELAWGVPFTSRPSALKGYLSYAPAAIDYADDKYAHLKGMNDTGRIFVVLADWDEQFHVISTEGKFLDTANDSGIIAYGEYKTDQNTGGFKTFEIPLEYRSSERIPKWAVIVASSSALGDYFTGGAGSKLWVDEFEFVYE